MRDELTDVADLIDGLRVSRPDHHPNPLAAAIQVLAKDCEASIQHAKQAKSLLEDEGFPKAHDVANLCALRRSCKDLATASEKLAETAEGCIASFIKTFGSQDLSQREILSHFDGEITSITRGVLDGTTEINESVWRIVEECYNQANSTSGSLHSDHYYVPQREADLGWPFDPDFESERYYDHVNRLDVDEGYAEAHRQRCERIMESRQESAQDWISLWGSKLRICPGGPTLFYPASAHNLEMSLGRIPPYLFRAADSESQGTSDDRVVASMMSKSGDFGNSKVDILQLPRKEAARQLAGHLRNQRFRGEESDNLMSWSSSLLFVIQCAIWRCHERGRSPKDVKIFVADTEKFPSGQFVRDKCLIRAYRYAAQSPGDEGFFEFRLDKEKYDNGEYLTQGLVNHAGRSCVLSLDMLMEAGLYSLYPELSEETESWTNRVLDLREAWSTKRTTNQREVQLALQIARKCFPGMDISDVAAILLSFKNRKCKENVKRKGPSFDFDTYLLI